MDILPNSKKRSEHSDIEDINEFGKSTVTLSTLKSPKIYDLF